MRVLMLGWEFPPQVKGGLAVACYGMAQALVKQGTGVLFVLPSYLGPKEDMEAPLQVVSASSQVLPAQVHASYDELVRFLWSERLAVHPLESLLYPYATQESYADHLRDLSAFRAEGQGSVEGQHYDLHGGYGPDLMQEVFRYSQLVGHLALEEQFDLVHAHDWMTYPAGMLVKALTGKPFVAHVHAMEHDRSGFHVNQEVAGIERAGLEYADQVVAVSHYTKNLIMQEYGVPASKITVVHNAVARSHTSVYVKEQRACREKRVLFMGRVTFQKGPDYFIEAANLVLQRMPDVRFIMAGNGDMLRRMVQRVAKLRIGSRVHFTGFLQGADVDRMYALSDLYVMPSVSEPFGITPLEAMLYDVPVIISKQSGVSEVVSHALKVDFWDVKEMANKICAVLNHQPLGRTIVRNCHDDLKHIKWENAAQELGTIYFNLTSGRSG